MRQNTQWRVEQTLETTPEDSRADVLEHAGVRLGINGEGPRVRIVVIQGEDEQIVLATNKPLGAMSAEMVGQLYRRRWQVEMFFRWIKCTLGCRHWLAESESGVAVQVYLALIAGQLLTLNQGRRPNKRQMEAIQMYIMGWATEDELEGLLAQGAKKREDSPSEKAERAEKTKKG